MDLEDIYKNIPQNRIPWIRESMPDVLLDVIIKYQGNINSILDLGCGIGNYTKQLATMGYSVYGIDISATAIELAKKQFKNEKLKGYFEVANLCEKHNLANIQVDFAFDYEVLHHIFPEGRKQYISNVHSMLKPGGYYLSISFCESDPYFGGKGKYRDTPLGTRLYFSNEREMKQLFQEDFNILELRTISIPGKGIPHRAIFCLLQNREAESTRR
jgi:cyclopropane fatty-acyl-phospholipid synthase-like methyltransferase